MAAPKAVRQISRLGQVGRPREAQQSYETSNAGLALGRLQIASRVHGLNANSNRTRTVEDRDIAGHVADDHDPGLGDTAVAIVDHEVIRPPESQGSHREVPLPRNLWQRRRQIAGLLLRR